LQINKRKLLNSKSIHKLLKNNKKIQRKIRKCKLPKKIKKIKIGYEKELTKELLTESFYEKFQYSKSRGIDGKKGSDLKIKPPYSGKKTSDISWILKKVKRNNYTFNAYQEIVVSKGKGKEPRIISKATIRDSLVLYTLKEYFKKKVKGSITTKANDIIQNVIENIKSIDNINDYIFYQTDIENYYGSINQKILLEKVNKIVNNDPKKDLIINLITKIIQNPTIEFGSRKNNERTTNKEGVPQGLSLSNILANLYMLEFDTKMKNLENEKNSGIIGYYRYVDDILIICKKKNFDNIEKNVKKDISNLDIKLHKDKTVTKDFSKEKTYVDFLGYIFSYKSEYYSKHLKLSNFIIKPRKKTSDNFLKSILSQFTKLKRGLYEISNLKNRKTATKKRNLLKSNFLFRLNILIAGCIANGNRYGFFTYFAKISTPYIAHQAQNIIEKELKKLLDAKFITSEEYKELKKEIKKPISSFFSTQNEEFFRRQTTINFDEYMTYQEYVNQIGKKKNESESEYYKRLDKKSPLEFVETYDNEHYEHLNEEYEDIKFRQKIYYYFNKLKEKNLDILSKDIKGATGNSPP